MSRIYVDDNYGVWDHMDVEDPDFDDREAFYFQVQRESVWKECAGCGHNVFIRAQYAYCNSCADARERGMDY